MVSEITPLRTWSGYSLLRGATHLERLVTAAAGIGCGRLALTDVNNLYGAPAFYRLARDAGLAPIIGAELHCGGGSAVALVASEAGYENLCRIITKIHAGGFAFHDDFAELSEGLHLIVDDVVLADRLLTALPGRERLWVGVDPETNDYARIRRITEFAGRRNLPLVATGDALLAEAGDRDVARLLAAIRLGTTYHAVPPGELPHPKAVLRTSEHLARALDGFPRAAANNRALAEQCAGFQFLPRTPVFPEFPCPDGRTSAAYLRRLCEEGMAGRYGSSVPRGALERLERELRLIERKGFSGYFLVVWDIVQYARGRGQPVAGRGSGGSSLAAYLLGITNVCPLAHDIPFERFLNENREDFPDLDIDFCWRIRDEVIEYAFGRWGADHVAMACTHNTFQPRSALREAARAFGYSDDQISHLNGQDFGDGNFLRIADLAGRIIGLPHHLSVHPGGIVLGRKGIDHYVPIEQAAKGVMITQYDKDGLEDAGLVKLDLLGNRGLSTVRYAADLIRRRTGTVVDVESLPPADGPTIAALRSGDTVGCNQLESPAMRHLLKAMRPAEIRDVMKVLALIRPGAAGVCLPADRGIGRQVGMKEVFIRRQRGLEAAPPLCPRVDAVLADTNGIMLYEDDVMLVAAAMMATSPAEADRFRKAVQKCRTDEQRLRLSEEFLARCEAGGIDRDYAKSMWVQMAKFNAYSFCRAHAASYAALSYAAAWLKTHYPLEFWTAALNNNQSMYHPRVYVEQAKRGDIRFLLPDVNRSQEEFTIDGEAIRVGFNFVSGLGPAGTGMILEARRQGPFAGLSDFHGRVGLAAEELRALVLCGAFDYSGRTRPVLMMELNLLATLRPNRRPGQKSMLNMEPFFPNPPGDYTSWRKYADERRILGISVREHVMARRRMRLPRGLVDADSRDLPQRTGKRVRIAGVLEALRTAETQNGRDMMFLTFDDEFGLFEVTVFPGAASRMLADSAGTAPRYGPYVITGKVEEQYGNITITADEITLHSAVNRLIGGSVNQEARECVHGGAAGLLSRRALAPARTGGGAGAPPPETEGSPIRPVPYSTPRAI